MKRENNLTANGNSPRHFTTTYVQTDTGSQQNHERVHELDYSTRTVQSQHKSACNPFASALADAFGIEEAYS